MCKFPISKVSYFQIFKSQKFQNSQTLQIPNFQNVDTCNSQQNQKMIIILTKNDNGFHIVLISVPLGSKNQKSWTLEVSVPPIIKPKFYLSKIEPNNSPELFNLLFQCILLKNEKKHAKTSLKFVLPMFPLFVAYF